MYRSFPHAAVLLSASLSEQILLEDGHQVALEVDVDGVGHRLSPAPLLLPAPGHLPLLVEGILCSGGGRGGR